MFSINRDSELTVLLESISRSQKTTEKRNLLFKILSLLKQDSLISAEEEKRMRELTFNDPTCKHLYNQIFSVIDGFSNIKEEKALSSPSTIIPEKKITIDSRSDHEKISDVMCLINHDSTSVLSLRTALQKLINIRPQCFFPNIIEAIKNVMTRIEDETCFSQSLQILANIADAHIEIGVLDDHIFHLLLVKLKSGSPQYSLWAFSVLSSATLSREQIQRLCREGVASKKSHEAKASAQIVAAVIEKVEVDEITVVELLKSLRLSTGDVCIPLFVAIGGLCKKAVLSQAAFNDMVIVLEEKLDRHHDSPDYLEENLLALRRCLECHDSLYLSDRSISSLSTLFSSQTISRKTEEELAALFTLGVSRGFIAAEEIPLIARDKQQQELFKKTTDDADLSLPATSEGEKSLDDLLREIQEKNPSVDIVSLRNDYNAMMDFYEEIKNWDKNQIKKWAKDIQGQSLDRVKVLAVIRCANILFTKGKEVPRISQLLTLLLMLKGNDSAGTLAQVNTGEGKTTIVAMLAVIKALEGKKVDIVTSSPVLAKRDAEKKKGFYALFGFCAGDNGGDDAHTYLNDIVYGSISAFQFDFLRDVYKDLGTRRSRPFDVIIADEVDSMLIDEGGKIAMLSEGIPGMEYLEALLTVVFLAVNQFNQSYRFDEATQRISFINPDDLSERVELDPTVDLAAFTKQHVSEQLRQACFSDQDNRFKVPKNLQSFAEAQLDDWIHHAIVASTLKEDKDYIIRGNDVLPVDYVNTGVIQSNTQWQKGLHQFVQIKHRLSMTPESFTTSFISNVGYFKKYGANIYGLTGTLGTMESKELLQRTYHVDCVIIPTYKVKKFEQMPAILCSEENAWIQAIATSTVEKLENGRAVLIICESISNVNLVYIALRHQGISDSVMVRYFDDSGEADISHIDGGQVIIATNLAGRGTDIETTAQVELAGGLHVCLTFLPSNLRVEEQAFGRTARQGKKGTGELVLGPDATHGASDLCDEDIYYDRDEREKDRLAYIQNHELRVITEKDKLFLDKFLPFLASLRKSCDKNIIKGIEERWGLFFAELDRHSFHVDFKSQHIFDQYDKFEAEIKADVSADSVIQSYAYYIRYGNDQSGNNKEESIRLYEKAIALDPIFAYAAHYNKAYLLIKHNLSSGLNELKAAQHAIEDTLMPQLQAMMGIFNPADPREQEIADDASTEEASSNQQDDDSKNSQFSKQFNVKFSLLQMHLQHINQAIKTIEEKSDNTDIVIDSEIGLEDLFETEKPTQEIQELYNSGISHYFTVKEKPKTDWLGIAAVFVIAAMQLVAGAALCLVGAVNLGSALISEGVGDLILAIKSAISGEFSWGDYLKEKAISIVVSLCTMGMSAVKTAFTSVSRTVQQGAVLVKEGLKLVGKKIATKLAEAGAMELLKYGANMLTTEFLNLFRSDIFSKIRRALESLKTQLLAVDLTKIQKSAHRFFTIKSSELLEIGEEIMRRIIAKKSSSSTAINALHNAIQLTDCAKAIDTCVTYAEQFSSHMRREVLHLPSGQKTEEKNDNSRMVDSMLEGWANQIVDKILGTIQGKLINPMIVDPTVNHAVNHVSSKIQRCCSSMNHTIDDKLYFHSQRLVVHQRAPRFSIQPSDRRSPSPQSLLLAQQHQDPADIRHLHVAAGIVDKNILVYDEGGALIEKASAAGRKETLKLRYIAPTTENPDGHYLLNDGTPVASSGQNNCFFDAVAAANTAHSDSSSKDGIHLKAQVLNVVNRDAKAQAAAGALGVLPAHKRKIGQGGAPGDKHEVSKINDPRFLKDGRLVLNNTIFYVSDQDNVDQRQLKPANADDIKSAGSVNLSFLEKEDGVLVPVINKKKDPNAYFLPFNQGDGGHLIAPLTNIPLDSPAHDTVITPHMTGCSLVQVIDRNKGSVTFYHDNKPGKNFQMYENFKKDGAEIVRIDHADDVGKWKTADHETVQSNSTYSRGVTNPSYFSIPAPPSQDVNNSYKIQPDRVVRASPMAGFVAFGYNSSSQRWEPRVQHHLFSMDPNKKQAEVYHDPGCSEISSSR